VTHSDIARGWVVPICGLLAITFTICTSELVIAGLLPTIAADLGVDIPTAGLLITGYAAGVALAGPFLSLATGHVRRKTLLLLILAAFIAGNALCAVAVDYTMLLVARLLMSASHGLFFGVALVLATRLAPEGRKASAVSMVLAGVSVAIIGGVPLGTAIGNTWGWRTTFWIIVLAGAFASLVVAWLIPADREARVSHDLAAELRAAARPIVLLCYFNIAVPLIAFFALLSYAVPLLTETGGVPLQWVPVVLFGTGVASFVGSLIGGRLADWNPTAAMIGVALIDIMLFILLSQVTAIGWASAVLLGVIWLVSFALPPPLQSLALREASDAPNLAATLMNTASQIGIALGAAFGGSIIARGWGYGQIPLLSSAFWALGLVGILIMVHQQRRVKLARGNA
jgi:MFS transporter, DHA1 family, inner membrane transport protein